MKSKLIINAAIIVMIIISPAIAFEIITGSAVQNSYGSFTVGNMAPVITAENFTGYAGDLVIINYTVYDPNGDNVTVNFTYPLNSSGMWQSDANDYGIHYSTISAYDGTYMSTLGIAMKLRPYCGDGNCTESVGENCGNCPEDCGNCPYVPPQSGGGGGSGAVSRKVVEELLKELEKLRQFKNVTENFTTGVNELFYEIQEDEFVSESLEIKNYENKTILVAVDAAGDISSSLIFDEKLLTIHKNSNTTLDFLVLANKPPGKYHGELILVSMTEQIIIPVTLKIIKRLADPEKETLDINIDLISSEVKPGDYLRFTINMRKTPLVIEDPEDVYLEYNLMQLTEESLDMISGAAVAGKSDEQAANRSMIIFQEEETMQLTNSKSMPKEILIPDDLPTGDYLLFLTARYKAKKIPLFVKFKVEYPWYTQKIFNVKKGVIALLILIISAIWIYFVTSKSYSASQQKVHIIKIDKTALPKKGSRSAFVGMVPEANTKAYINFEDLKTHSLVSGTTGSGKTIAAQDIVEEVISKDITIIVFDPTTQWVGFLRKCKDPAMLRRYPAFDMKKRKDPKSFPAKIYRIEGDRTYYEIPKLLKNKFNIVLLDKLNSKELDEYIARTIMDVFKYHPSENKKLQLLIVFDEVHRLLPRFGGSGKGYTALERAVREFRKWGIGVLLVSQVTQDLVGPIEANVATQIQLKTNDKGDLTRIEKKYGKDILRAVFRSPVGTGLMSNSSYNSGKPYFIAFRPIRHNTAGLNKRTLRKHIYYSNLIQELQDSIAKLEKKKKGAALELSIELGLAEKQIYSGKYDMAQIYLDSLIPKIEKKLNIKIDVDMKNKEKKEKKKKKILGKEEEKELEEFLKKSRKQKNKQSKRRSAEKEKNKSEKQEEKKPEDDKKEKTAEPKNLDNKGMIGKLLDQVMPEIKKEEKSKGKK